MERLTQREKHCPNPKEIYGVSVKGHDYIAAANRLAGYKDTKLTPELMQETVELALWVHENGLEKIKEWIKADKDGRLVVLPCKDWLNIVFGEQTQFWGIDKNYIENPIRKISVDNAERISWYDGWETAFLKGVDENGLTWEFTPCEIGKTVFLTYDEAEEALEAMKDG